MYQNVGTIPVEAHVTFTNAPEVLMRYYSSGGSYDLGTRTVTWDVGTLSPGWTDWFYVTVQIPPDVPLQTDLVSNAQVQPGSGTDATPLDNTVDEHEFVRGSYDPNEKQVTPEGVIERTDLLTYQIDFQNVGNDTAFIVVVRDTLDPKLDLSTFKSGASIHPYTYAISGREISWTFADIDLPDSTTNEAASHGLVKFSIYPIPSAPVGSLIDNYASIFFDQNPPVITDTVSNQIANHSNCTYVVGDANGVGGFTGLDVIYSVRYFKGGPHPPFTCDCPPYGTWYVAGDVNASCSFTGLDITKMVRHFKYYDLVYPCPDCPPMGRR
jgi:uncharacterized repeat protein (TIGR01451 family)